MLRQHSSYTIHSCLAYKFLELSAIHEHHVEDIKMEYHIIGHAVFTLIVSVVSSLGDSIGQGEAVPLLPVLKGLNSLGHLGRLMRTDVNECLLLKVPLVLLTHQSLSHRLDTESLVRPYELCIGRQLVSFLALSEVLLHLGFVLRV